MKLKAKTTQNVQIDRKPVSDPIRLERKNGRSVFGNGTTPISTIHIEIENGRVVTREENSIPWKGPDKKMVGIALAIIDTNHIKEDEKASTLVQAQLERIRGGMRDASVEAIQLTEGLRAEFTPKFVIYMPFRK